MTKIYEPYRRYDDYSDFRKGSAVKPSKMVARRVLSVSRFKEPTPREKKPGKAQGIIDSIAAELKTKRFVELSTDDPFHFRKSLHDCARRRGLTWSFATTERSVFVYVRP